MKTNKSARKIRKVRNTMFCLAIVGLAGLAFTMGQSLAARFGQATIYQAAGPQAPNAEVGVLFASLK